MPGLDSCGTSKECCEHDRACARDYAYNEEPEVLDSMTQCEERAYINDPHGLSRTCLTAAAPAARPGTGCHTYTFHHTLIWDIKLNDPLLRLYVIISSGKTKIAYMYSLDDP
jgi:hypothetical protein